MMMAFLGVENNRNGSSRNDHSICGGGTLCNPPPLAESAVDHGADSTGNNVGDDFKQGHPNSSS